MKPNTQITADLLDNSEFFSNDFFNRFTLRQAPAPLRLTDAIEKHYQFPTFYADVTCAMAIFFCSYKRAKALLPHPDMQPVRMGKGRAMVIFSCYEYKNVLGVAPYNEIAMTIPILMNPGISVPVLPMLLPTFKNFGYHCFSMPVTSLENKIRGHEFWGLPKIVEEIPVSINDNNCCVKAVDQHQNQYFELNVPTDGNAEDFDVGSYLYSVKADKLLKSKTCFQGKFQVNKFTGTLLKKGTLPNREYLKIGSGPSADVLRKLEIEPHPFQFRFCSSMNSCFDLPVDD